MKIVMLDRKTLGYDMDVSIFEKFGEFEFFDMSTAQEAKDRIKNADIIINNKVMLSEDVLKNARNLKLIALVSTGLNAVDIKYAERNSIAVCNVAGYSTQSVVQHTFASLLYVFEGLRIYDDFVKSGKYSQTNLFTSYIFPFNELNSKTFGIIGLGNIGGKVAQTAEAFGCSVVYYSTTGKNKSEKYKRLEIDELLKVSDIVSIHCALNEKTENLIDYKRLSIMKKSAVILNMGRGKIINEKDLARALNENMIHSAVLDVMENEPLKKDSPLLNLNNPDKILITPHIAWAAVESRERLLKEVKMNIEAFLKGERRNRAV